MIKSIKERIVLFGKYYKRMYLRKRDFLYYFFSVVLDSVFIKVNKQKFTKKEANNDEVLKEVLHKVYVEEYNKLEHSSAVSDLLLTHLKKYLDDKDLLFKRIFGVKNNMYSYHLKDYLLIDSDMLNFSQYDKIKKCIGKELSVDFEVGVVGDFIVFFKKS